MPNLLALEHRQNLEVSLATGCAASPEDPLPVEFIVELATMRCEDVSEMRFVPHARNVLFLASADTICSNILQYTLWKSQPQPQASQTFGSVLAEISFAAVRARSKGLVKCEVSTRSFIATHSDLLGDGLRNPQNRNSPIPGGRCHQRSLSWQWPF